MSTEIRWLPFQLNPDMPPEGMPRAAYRTAKFGSVERSRELDARVASEGKSEGIEFAFERIERTPNTVAAHTLVGLAQEQGRGDAVVDALFRAYFEDAQDIGDTETLAAIATALRRVRLAPSRRRGRSRRARPADARARDLRRCRPSSSRRKLGVSGAQPPETLAASDPRNGGLLGEVEPGFQHQAVDRQRRPVRELERRQLLRAERLHRRRRAPS